MSTAAKVTGGIAALLVAVPALLYAWTLLRPHEIHTRVDIDAPPSRVWEVLTDFAAYPEWNPFIERAEGRAEAGARLSNHLRVNGEIMVFGPTVLAASPGRELRWLGRFVMPGVVEGEHTFTIEDLGGGRSRLVQHEKFTGALVPFAGSTLDVVDEFNAMNAALKARAETMVR
ncbi:SRPBCC domain-containing protein [Sinosporangium siamense]|uniref:SRPBCC domain-containing protein n=1 Tax=Sinosporangium siamense TaxID=1367973 RepID=A0A919V9W7_9ACTN|nr:SRPBCC domain-containing protein [Sinosporangium siamense]GII90529.1 hypothetical protein Ssi02_07600 [Sinosporangium siamense]